mmetsp:Transcript_11070/g.41299  ORF Transcript_11070/g.41299 Transcript_11070/m.41299 type:complete len:87 (-) Transcript_11070:1704-1964(-)
MVNVSLQGILPVRRRKIIGKLCFQSSNHYMTNFSSKSQLELNSAPFPADMKRIPISQRHFREWWNWTSTLEMIELIHFSMWMLFIH